MRFSIAFLILFAFFRLSPELQADTNVVVSFVTTNSTPLNIGFAGFTTELLGKGIEYGDTNMQSYASMLSPGWILFPAGTTGDAFDWQTGLTRTDWVAELSEMENTNNDASTLAAQTEQPLIGKGGAWFTNFATLADNLGGAKIIVCVNALSDTNPADAGAFAAFALSNHIHVAAWELCNEPYLFQGSNDFFPNGTAYATNMLPYAAAITNADPNAVVAMFFSDPSRTGVSWDNDLKRYGATNQYWKAVVYHYYPGLSTNDTFDELMAQDNGILFSNSTLYVTNVLMADSQPGTTFLLTELNPILGTGGGGQNLPTSSLYGGIFDTEYIMRLSTCPSVSFAGSYQLVNGSGVNYTNEFAVACTTAAAGGYTTNTVGLPFGYYLSAQGTAEAVAYWAINRSTAVYATTVGTTNCPVVSMDTNGIGTMLAIYAVAYQGGNGKRYVVLTNKGTNAVPVLITQDTNVLTNTFLETFVTGPDPSATNSNPTNNNIFIQSMTVTNPVSIPEYSVVRLEWVVTNVPPPAIALTLTPTNQDLKWSGFTNVVYNVQAITNLLAPWTTLGRIAGTTTNFAYTNWNTTLQQFYRLTVP